MALALAASCLLIGFVSLLGGLLPLAAVMTHTRLQTYLSFSAGTMLGAAFFHMMPEAVRIGSPTTLSWSAVGLLALFFLERFFSFHQHEIKPERSVTIATLAETEDPATAGCGDGHDGHHHAVVERRGGVPPTDAFQWGSAAFGLAVHSLAGGVALASAVASDFQRSGRLASAGLGVLIATVVHKPADALTITALMVRAGVPRRSAHLLNLGFALMIPVGAMLFFLGTSTMSSGADTAAKLTSAALAFSAGTFLCIALSDLLPELQFHSHDRVRLSIALLSGIALMAATALIEPA